LGGRTRIGVLDAPRDHAAVKCHASAFTLRLRLTIAFEPPIGATGVDPPGRADESVSAIISFG
jgi:hypothetical protein